MPDDIQYSFELDEKLSRYVKERGCILIEFGTLLEHLLGGIGIIRKKNTWYKGTRRRSALVSPECTFNLYLCTYFSVPLINARHHDR